MKLSFSNPSSGEKTALYSSEYVYEIVVAIDRGTHKEKSQLDFQQESVDDGFFILGRLKNLMPHNQLRTKMTFFVM